MRALKLLLALNCIAAVAFALMWFHVAWLVPVRSAMRVTELDRAQVFDEVKLRQSFPVLAENLRYRLAAWVVEEAHQAAITGTVAGLAVTLFNAVFLLVLLRFVRRRSLNTKEHSQRKESRIESGAS